MSRAALEELSVEWSECELFQIWSLLLSVVVFSFLIEVLDLDGLDFLRWRGIRTEGIHVPRPRHRVLFLELVQLPLMKCGEVLLGCLHRALHGAEVLLITPGCVYVLQRVPPTFEGRIIN